MAVMKIFSAGYDPFDNPSPAYTFTSEDYAAKFSKKFRLEPSDLKVDDPEVIAFLDSGLNVFTVYETDDQIIVQQRDRYAPEMMVFNASIEVDEESNKVTATPSGTYSSIVHAKDKLEAVRRYLAHTGAKE